VTAGTAGDDTSRSALAAYALFTAVPTDRALAGWRGADHAGEPEAVLKAWLRLAAAEGGA
jgi:hypothetical protein